MPNKILTIDGKRVAVDANRYEAFDAVRDELQRRVIGQSIPLQSRDAGEALAFMVSQLAYTEAETYKKLYTPMQFRELVPVKNEGGWADTIRYELMDWTGKGKRISGSGRDLPRADVQFGEKLVPVVSGAVEYHWTYEELKKSAFFRTPLSSARLAVAMEMAERHFNDVALFGEASSNLTGLFNNANVPQGNAPIGSWASATPAQIVADINTGIFNIWNNTKFNDYVTHIVLSPEKYQYLLTTPLNTENGSNYTILKYILENNLSKLQRQIDLKIMPGFGLETAGSGGTHRALFYVRNETRIKMHIPQELEFLAPQFNDLEFKVPGVYRYSGVHFRYPKSAMYMDNL